MSQTRKLGARGRKRLHTVPIVSTSTFKCGDYLVWHTSNGGQIAAAAGSPVAAIGADAMILGRAVEDALDENGTVKTHVSFIVWEPATEFELWIYHATAASAVATPLTQLGVAFELIHATPTALGWGVDISETTDTKCIITDYFTEDLPTWPKAVTAGTNLSPSVWVTPMEASCALSR